MAFIILFLTILFVGVIQIFIPFLVKRTVVFGVSVPYEHANHPKVREYKKRYALLTSILSFVILGGFITWHQGQNISEPTLAAIGVITPFVIIIFGLLLYLLFHYKMVQLKQSQNWYSDVKQVHFTDITIRSKDEMIASVAHLIPLLVSAGVILISINGYDQLPSQIPTHWGPNGKADAFRDKSMMVVLSLPIILILMQLMFFFINYFTKKSGIKINAGNVPSSKMRQLRLRKYTSWFLFAVNILISLLFTMLQLNLIYENIFNETFMMLFPIGFLIFIFGGAIWFMVKVGSVDSDFDKNLVTEKGNTVEGMDEDQYWKGGLFYFNRNDPSVFVEKRFGIGFTINFANPIGYFVLLIPILLIILLPIFFTK